MYIKEMRVFGFKRFSKLQVELSPGINIVVGDNDAGKSTLLEVITAVLDGQYRGTSLARNLSEDLFNAENVATYIKNIRSGTQCEPPEILIEAVFGGNDQEELLALYEGDANSKGRRNLVYPFASPWIQTHSPMNIKNSLIPENALEFR